MANKGYSRRGMFGDIHHYDEKGRKVGTSRPGLFGGYTNYDVKGKRTGHSTPGLFGAYNHYDKNGRRTGRSNPGIFGGYIHYDSKNKKKGSSTPTLFGNYSHNTSNGCYIATAVYGTYDCPELWTLRRYRDRKLAKSRCGRAFIRAYYSISPTLVKKAGRSAWFKKVWKRRLDIIISE